MYWHAGLSLTIYSRRGMATGSTSYHACDGLPARFSRLMKNASLGNSERAGVGIEAPLDADSEEAAPWVAPDRSAGASG